MTAAIHVTQSSEYTTPKSFCFSYLELSPSYLKVVLKLSLNCLRVLSQGCLQVVSKWSSSCLKSVPKLPKSCLKVVAQRCVQVVLKLCLSCSKWCASDDSHDRDDHHDHPDDQHGEILGAGGLWPANREIPPFPPQEPGSNHHHHRRYHHNHSHNNINNNVTIMMILKVTIIIREHIFWEHRFVIKDTCGVEESFPNCSEK